MSIRIIIDAQTIIDNAQTNIELAEILTGKKIPMEKVIKELEASPRTMECKGLSMKRGYDNSCEIVINDVTLKGVSGWLMRWVPVLAEQGKFIMGMIKPVKKLFKRMGASHESLMEDLISDMKVDGKPYDEYIQERLDKMFPKFTTDEQLVEMLRAETLANLEAHHKLDIQKGEEYDLAEYIRKLDSARNKTDWPSNRKDKINALADLMNDTANTYLQLQILMAGVDHEEIIKATEEYQKSMVENSHKLADLMDEKVPEVDPFDDFYGTTTQSAFCDNIEKINTFNKRSADKTKDMLKRMVKKARKDLKDRCAVKETVERHFAENPDWPE